MYVVIHNKLEKTIFVLLRVFGVLSIMVFYLEADDAFGKMNLVIFRHRVLVGNVYMISPKVLIGMIVTIIIYLVFIKFLKKHISISKKASD